MFYTHNKSTFIYDMAIQDHLLRDRPHQEIGISSRMCYFIMAIIMARLESTGKQQAS